MLQLLINGQPLDVLGDDTLEIEETNPIFNDRGTQSLPINLPATTANRVLLGFPDNLMSVADPNNPLKHAQVVSGAYRRNGILNVDRAGRRSGISVNVGFDNSTLYTKWIKKKLADLENLPVLTFEDTEGRGPVVGLMRQIDKWASFAPENLDPDLVVFPIVVERKELDSQKGDTIYWEVLNNLHRSIIMDYSPTHKIDMLIDGEVREVTVPCGYGLTPFLKVWRIVELAFENAGLTIEGDNPLRTVPDLAQLVVLNNTADGVATGELRYSELMPDCTVGEFMETLWARFGLTYAVNFNTGKVRMRLIRDVMKDQTELDVDSLASGACDIIHNAPQYIKMTANCSLEGAEPPCERFEDFAGEASKREIVQGLDVTQWLNKYIYADEAEAELPETVAREIITGTWHRLDTENRIFRLSGSGFFNWDPQPDGAEPLELTGHDECVPVMFVEPMQNGAGRGYCPAYLCGSKHLHSIVKGSEADPHHPSAEEKTPLAFVLACRESSYPICGRISPEGVTLADGSPASISLTYQFRGGLFDSFWREYDEFLRHANRTVELPAQIPLTRLLSVDVLRPVRYCNTPCLVDSMRYTLPSGPSVDVELELRSMAGVGAYNLQAEQRVAPVELVKGCYKWQAIATDREEVVASISPAEVLDNWQDYFDPYKDANGVWHFLAEESVRFRNFYGGDWRDYKPDPSGGTVCQIIISLDTFLVFEIHEITSRNMANRGDWVVNPEPFSRTYTDRRTVQWTLAPRWVPLEPQ